MAVTDERLNQLANDPLMCNITPEVQGCLRELQSLRSGNNYIKQFTDAKEKCAVMYPPEEVYTDEQLSHWAEEHGFQKP